MRHLFIGLLLVLAGPASAQVEWPDALAFADMDADLSQGGPAWLVGDHVKARRHFRAAAERGHPLGQYNLAMMLLHQEGGPCGTAEAVALLRKAADGGVGLAREALQQVKAGAGMTQAVERAFPCPSPSHARPTRVAGSVRRLGAR